MIKKLRFQFVTAAMLTLTLVLAVILGGINLVSFWKAVGDSDRILALLSENDGTFPKIGEEYRRRDIRKDNIFDRTISPEVPFESRYFSVKLRGDEVEALDTRNIAAVDDETAEEYARSVLASGRERGFVRNYRYLVSTDGEVATVLFLDFGRTVESLRTSFLAGLGVSAGGLAAVLALLIPISGRIVKPIGESYEKQRRFITDAGHEIKTPLTIISADADLLELETGENEWLEDIRRQTQRLIGLTNDLIYLSRMEETQERTAIEFSLSDVVEETARAFQGPAAQKGQSLQIHVPPMLSFTGNEEEMRKLVSILMDNAVKYAVEGSTISLVLTREEKTVRLSVSNETTGIPEPEKLPRLFDRFYRTDDSRNSETGGYGLGLSIARQIVRMHRGKITAESPDGKTLTFTAVFPDQNSPKP